MNKQKWYSWALALLVVVAVGYMIARNFGELRKYDFDFRWGFIILALLSEVSAYLSKLVIWQHLSRSYGLKVPLIKAGKGFFLSQLGRYIPGKVGLLLIRMETYREYSRKNTAIATGVEMISTIGGACILVLIGIIAAGEYLPSYSIWVALIGFAAVLIFLWPGIFKPLANFGFRLIKRSPMEEVPPYSVTLKYVAVYLFPGLLHGLGLFMVLCSLSPISFAFYLPITSIYFAAGIVGLLAVFVPAGLGVREGVMMLVLPLIVDKPIVIVGVILSRMVLTLSEISLAGIFTVLDKFNSK
ncbi:flippase-like domain-containing protein [bacterium]|nr:flippase-like domain-containing protein [bacterium]